MGASAPSRGDKVSKYNKGIRMIDQVDGKKIDFINTKELVSFLVITNISTTEKRARAIISDNIRGKTRRSFGTLEFKYID